VRYLPRGGEQAVARDRVSDVDLPTIDAWRAAHWGQPGACQCGDPIILADTEDWPVPLCFDCWAKQVSIPAEQS
jgi:hypothetical protein